MSVAAVMLVKDEADVIGFTVDWLLSQVDHVYVMDNKSTDGTHDIVSAYGPARVTVIYDPTVGYWQSRKTTALAMRALKDGYDWVVPCDADEWWYSPDGRTIGQLLGGLAPDVQFVKADLYNHLPSATDKVAWCADCGTDGEIVLPSPPNGKPILRVEGGMAVIACPRCGGDVEPNPFRRIGWRQREHGVLGKVACRLRPDLIIHAGNHGAETGGTGLTSSGLVVRHFSWRSPEQYVRKIRNGEAAYAQTTLPESTGAHWRMWDGKPDEALVDHFRTWFWSPDPHKDATLIYDPAPGA